MLPITRGRRFLRAAIAAVFIGAGTVTPLTTTSATAATPDYSPTVDSLNSHPLPQWFDDAKFGIFIHWGAYSVPAYAPIDTGGHGGYNYAEWYGKFMHTKNSPFYDHHRDTYGTDYDYDRFLDEWQTPDYRPDEWIETFKDAGAKYVVLTAKHHEGVGLWDTPTGRDVVDRGPKRDLAGELVSAAREAGGIKAGFYYSLPDWYHPKSPGGTQRTNPYTGEALPYTGVDVSGDYIEDYMKPQIEDLVTKYDPDILWCDGQWYGSAATWNMAPVIADFYNQAKNRRKPKEVVVNNRCKIETGELDSDELDFQTPEYTTKDTITEQKWEASRGIGKSYGYNRFETDAHYQTADEIITSLVDIVSKNGNLLLNVGPSASGEIPALQLERLRSVGAWMDINGEAIYGTTYHTRAEDSVSAVPVRYTTKKRKNGKDVLYATATEWPGKTLTIKPDFPLKRGSTVRLLGSRSSKPLKWRANGDGTITITTPASSAATRSEGTYVFKMTR